MKTSVKSVDILYKTSGLIEKNSIEISKTMYILLFDLHPEFKVLFKNAPSDQHKLLAETMSSYAVNIKNIHILKPALEKIAKTHVNNGVKPYQYKIISHMLLLSYKVVLGDDATDELIDAWKEAIECVSDILIKLEKELYLKNLQ
ncbi:MAG: globin domain-containing protein [Sulfurimonas sp.]|nr:globin domain-containing protein [Sulfurimonas sp.]